MDKVIYSDAREYKLMVNYLTSTDCLRSYIKCHRKTHQLNILENPLIYADLRNAPGKRPMAVPLSTYEYILNFSYSGYM